MSNKSSAAVLSRLTIVIILKGMKFKMPGSLNYFINTFMGHPWL